MTRILCCGDRNWTDWQTVRRVFKTFPPGTIIVEGENGEVDKDGRITRGADKICARVAMDFGFECLGFPAEWKTYGRAAGPIRNKKMIDVGKPDRVIAFHPDITKSKGTANMVRQSLGKRLPVDVYSGQVCKECVGCGLDHPASAKYRNTDDDSCPVCGGIGLVVCEMRR